jgi:hypothetical protein
MGAVDTGETKGREAAELLSLWRSNDKLLRFAGSHPRALTMENRRG